MADSLTDMLAGAQPGPAGGSRAVRRWDARRPGRAPALLGALAAAMVTPLLARYGDAQWESAAVVLAIFGVCAALLGREPRWAPLLPLAGVSARVAAPVLATLILIVVTRVSDVPDLPTFACVKAGALALVVSMLARRMMVRFLAPPPIRAALIGSQFSADSLARELLVAHESRHVIVGRIRPADDEDEGEVPVLGRLSELGPLVARDEIDLLLMTGDVPRLAVFDEVARSCLELPVRLHEVSSFYEEVFGHVPVAEINASWFQYLMHPRYRAGKGGASRALDIVVAGLALVLAGPVIGFFALLIRRDGGPAFFRQERIGERGRPFTLTKLRTMRENAEVAWSKSEDPRVTRVGRVLRRSHLDELPQLMNVLRGEMSIVGPRPEQPEFVDRLEHVVPFYTRRHLTKPGLTGWAQVRCGYAGSDLGSAWKVCHDLYYLKHRSLGLDLLILFETLRTLVADPQYTAEPSSVAFILGEQRAAMTPDGSALLT